MMQCLQSAFRLSFKCFPVEQDAMLVDGEGCGVSIVDFSHVIFARISSESNDKSNQVDWCFDINL